MANPTHITANGEVAEAVTNSEFEKVRVDGELAGGVLTITAVIDGKEYQCARIENTGLFKAADISTDWTITEFKLRMEGARTTGNDPLDLYVTFS